MSERMSTSGAAVAGARQTEVAVLAEQFLVSLTELTQEAIASANRDDEMMADYEDFALVDLSSLDDA